MTNHADPLDKAAELADMYNENGIRTVRNKIKPEQVRGEDGAWPITQCVDCGIDIPQGRLALGKIRCLGCQEDLEKQNRLYGR